MFEIFCASWRQTMPLASSWKTRDRIGGGMLSTPVLMFSTMTVWSQVKTKVTLLWHVLNVLQLSLSRPKGSMSSRLCALRSSKSSHSSISPKAIACRRLKRRTTRCLKRLISSGCAVECLQKDMIALAASIHSARIWCVAVQPCQNLEYASEVRKTTRKPTRALNPLHAVLFSSTLSRTMMLYCFRKKATAEHGRATRKDPGKRLPLI
mmetsp:Transcript_112121/g.317196  ORF Transcript_112121/g.317196 Transcript_112121/m.317196 type:complete len:208 (+) Transcript_112121:1102-1725(+)